MRHSPSEVRYFVLSEKAVRELVAELPFSDYMDKRLNAGVLWNRCEPLMKKLDIQTDYELYSLLKNNEELVPEYVHFRHAPTFEIGEADFETQVIEMATKHSEWRISHLAALMSEAYGFYTKSLMASVEFKNTVNKNRPARKSA